MKTNHKIRFVSNRDGHSGNRGTSFASAIPNSYRIERDGETIGSINQISNHPLHHINAAFAGRGNVWIAYDSNGRQCAINQSIEAVKTAVRKRN